MELDPPHVLRWLRIVISDPETVIFIFVQFKCKTLNLVNNGHHIDSAIFNFLFSISES